MNRAPSFGLDALIEQRIRTTIARGEFDDLRGRFLDSAAPMPHLPPRCLPKES